MRFFSFVFAGLYRLRGHLFNLVNLVLVLAGSELHLKRCQILVIDGERVAEGVQQAALNFLGTVGGVALHSLTGVLHEVVVCEPKRRRLKV